MIGTPLAQRLLRLEYGLVRAPLGALDARVSRRLSDRSRVRLTIERTLAGCDAVAARLLNDPELARRADVFARHASAAEKAAERAEAAEQLRAAAAQETQEGVTAAERKRSEAAQEQRERVEQARRDKQDAEKQAVAQARETAAEKKQQAAKQASARTRQAAAARATEQRRISERTDRATAPAKSVLKDAAKEKGAAAERRGEAAKLARLAETEKKQRQARNS